MAKKTKELTDVLYRREEKSSKLLSGQDKYCPHSRLMGSHDFNSPFNDWRCMLQEETSTFNKNLYFGSCRSSDYNQCSIYKRA